MNFFLDENVPLSVKDAIHNLGFKVFALHNFNMLGIQNGEVARFALKEKAIIIPLDSNFL